MKRLLTLTCVSLLSGCLGIHNGHPDQRGPRNVDPHERGDTAQPVRWERIYFGKLPKPELMGYLKTTHPSDPQRGTRWVFDADFRLVGYITPDGQTIRITRGGEQRVGGFRVDHALLRLWLREKETEVRLRDMPDPRG